MRTIFAALAGLVVAAVPLHAQDSPAYELLDRSQAAYAEGDTEEAARLAEQAVGEAVAPGERFDALIVYGDLRSEAGDHFAAYELYSRVVELVEENDPENIAALDLALGRKASAAMSLGRREEWIGLSERMQQLNRTAEAPLWRFEDNMQARHRLSGYPCPANAEGLVRVELVTYDALGTDVSCRYAVPDTPGPVITLHAFLTGTSQDGAYEAARDGMLRNFNRARRVEEGEIEISGVPVRFGIYRQSGTTGGVWTTQLDEWTLKLRLSHYGELEREQLDAAARLTFSGAADVAHHLRFCAALDGNGSLQSSRAPEAPLEIALTLIASEAAASAAPSPQDQYDALECFIGDAAFRPSGGRVLARVDDHGDVLDYRAYPRGSTNVYLQAKPLQGLHAAAIGQDGASPLENGDRWILVQITPERTGVYGEFDGMPSPQVFREAVAGILDGGIPLIAWLLEDEDGGLQIELVDPQIQTEGR